MTSRAVIVGIGAYGGSWSPLAHPVQDARAFARLLEDDFGFDLEGGAPLLDVQATRQAIESAVARSLQRSDCGTRWLFYFAGHGLAAETGHLVPYGARGCMPEDLLALPWLLARCLESRCAETLVVLDACYAGQALVRPEELTDSLEPAGSGPDTVRQVLAAGGPGQQVLDVGGEGHSIFTQCLLEALEGWAGIHHEDGSIYLTELRDHLRDAIPDRLGRPAQSDEEIQRVVGGSLAPSASQRDFPFIPVLPRLRPETFRWLRGSDPEVIRRGLVQLGEEIQTAPSTVPLATRLVAGVLEAGSAGIATPTRSRGEPPEAVRSAAMGTLGRLLEVVTDGSVGDRLPERRLLRSLWQHAGDDPSGEVRDAARRALAFAGSGTQRRLARDIARLGRRLPWRRRCRLEMIAVELAAARRNLPAGLRLRIPWLLAAARTASAWRWSRRTTLRRWAVAFFPLAFLGVYLVLATLYFPSTASTSSVVLRAGHPGFRILPGVGEPLVQTDFSVRDLLDPSPFREERIVGSWLAVRRGSFAWGDTLARRLSPPLDSLTLWRLGEPEEAWDRLRTAIAAGDGRGVELLVYLATISEADLESSLSLLADAVQGPESLRNDALAALSTLRTIRPASAPRAVAILAKRLAQEPGSPTPLLEALAVVGEERGERAGPAVDALLAHLENPKGGGKDRLEAIRALDHLLPGSPGLDGFALARLCTASLQGSVTERAALLALLTRLPVPRQVPVEPCLSSTAGDALRSQAPELRRAGLHLATHLLPSTPSIRGPLLASLESLSRDSDPRARLEAALELAALPPPVGSSTPAGQILGSIAAGPADLATRTRALQGLLALDPSLASPATLAALDRAAGDPNAVLRSQAVELARELLLRSPAASRRLSAIVHGSLGDRDPWVRREAAAAVLLLADRFPSELPAALAQLLTDLADHDDPAGREERLRLAREFRESSDAAAALVGGGLVARLPNGDTSLAGDVLRFVSDLGMARPGALPALVDALADLAAEADTTDVSELARLHLWELRETPRKQLTPIVDRLLHTLTTNPRPSSRTAAALAVGALASGQPGLALRSASALATHLTDASPAVRREAARSLGILGRAQAAAAAAAALALADGLGTPDPELRRGCAASLARLTETRSLPDRSADRAIAALADPDPAVRRSVASALARAARHHEGNLLAALPPLRRCLDREPEPAVRSACAGALGILAGNRPDAGRRVLAVADRVLASGDLRQAPFAISLLRDLGEASATLAPASQERLGRLLTRPSGVDPRWVILALRDIGLARPELASPIFEILATVLTDGDPSIRWDAIANGLLPLVEQHPALAPRAVAILRCVLRRGDSPRVVGDEAFEALVQTVTLLAARDPSVAVSLLGSTSSFERRAGEASLLRLARRDPAARGPLLGRLARLRRSLEPQLRLAAARTWEGLTLLSRSHAAAGGPPALRDGWKNALEPLRRFLPDEAIKAARAELAGPATVVSESP